MKRFIRPLLLLQTLVMFLHILQVRQKLARLEERHRLTHNLQDSIQQQIFAASLQIGATRLLLKRDVNAAEVRLQEAEKLVRLVGQALIKVHP